jgi:hypothetical protein
MNSLSEKAHVQYLLNLVKSKGDRIDDFSEKQVICIIANKKTAECVTRIPGYGPLIDKPPLICSRRVDGKEIILQSTINSTHRNMSSRLLSKDK